MNFLNHHECNIQMSTSTAEKFNLHFGSKNHIQKLDIVKLLLNSLRRQKLVSLYFHTAYSSGAPESTPGFLVGSMFICFCFLMFCLCCSCLVLAVLRSLSIIVDFPLSRISHWYFFISLLIISITQSCRKLRTLRIG